MSIVTAISDFFKKSPDSLNSSVSALGPKGLYTPILDAKDRIQQCLEALNSGLFDPYASTWWMNGPKAYPHAKDVVANSYSLYYKALSNRLRQEENRTVFAAFQKGLTSILRNIEAIEDNFGKLFGSVLTKDSPVDIKVSTLLVLGYIEMTNVTADWFGYFLEVATAEDADVIPPFWFRSLTDKATDVGKFITSNVENWNVGNHKFIDNIKAVQKGGLDVSIKTGNSYIDEYVSDRVFSDSEQVLMKASLSNPIMMIANWDHSNHTELHGLYAARKDWLVAKVALLQAKLANMDPNSAEYKKLSRACDKYMAMVTKYEAKLQRLLV